MRTRILLVVALAILLSTGSHAQVPTDPTAVLTWLRTLTVEARIELKYPSGSRPPSLFNETMPDGRALIDYIADTLGATAGGDPAQPAVPNQWAILDEAVSLLLAEAEKMKELAAAKAGTAEEAKFQNARKQYLAGAAKLLRYYKVAAGDVFDTTAGAQANPLTLPDFTLPGDIVIKQISGAARLNTQSGEFSGRMSGRLELPGFRSTLVISDASFNSDGSFDLSAHGTLDFNGGQLAISSRKPAHLGFRPQRGVTFEGDARLSLSNGLRFDASMSLRDPQYCFSLAARGLEFDVTRQLMLRRVVIQNNAVENLGGEALGALGDYLQSLSGAAETLLAASTNFPPISETEFGQPPEFSAPEITFDFSSLSAWSSEIIANTQAGLSNAQQSVQTVLDSLQRLNEQARVATNAIADETRRLGNLAARLELRRRMWTATSNAVAQGKVSGADGQQLNQKLIAGAQQEGAMVAAIITPDLLDRLDEASEVVELLLNAEGGLQLFGGGTPSAPNLPDDPCAAVTNSAASLVQRAEALALCAARRHVARYGIDAVTGSITNTNAFNSLTEFELIRTGRLLADLEATLVQQGIGVQGDFVTFVEPILNRQREMLLAGLAESSSLARSIELFTLLMQNVSDSTEALDNEALVSDATAQLLRLQTNATRAEFDSAKTEANAALASRYRAIGSDVRRITGRNRFVGAVRPGDRYQPDFLTQLDQFFRVMGLPVPDAVSTNIDEYVRFKVQEMRGRPFTIEFMTNRLNEAQGIASAIIGLTDWADTRLTNDFSALTNLQFTITNFSHSFSAAAEAQRAWWLLDRYQEALRKHSAAYGENVHAGLRQAERRAHAGSIAASMRVAGAFSNLVANIVVRDDVIVPLPGKVEVTRIFGKLCYDRIAGSLSGCFGGRLEFPEVATNAFFEINNACLDSLGNYLISASTAFPISYGRSDLEATVNVTGSPAGVATFSGNGTITVSNGVAGTQVLNVSLAYDQPQRRLSFDALGTGLDIQLAEDFVIFDAGIGFDLKQGSPEGSFRATGSAGIMARQRPLPPSIDRTNFFLVVDGLTTTFSYSSNAFTVALSNGTIRLPEFFHNGLCPTNAGQPPTGAQLALVPSNPIAVTIGVGPSPSASFAGALDFRNLGFNVPGLTNLGVEVCSARLLFRSNGLPCFTNLNATLSIPLPQQTVLMDVNGVVWCIDGFPDAATVGLRQPLRLFDVGGVAFEFQTNTTFGFATSSGAAAASPRAKATGGQRTTFTVAGGLRGSFDASMLADAQTGSGFTFGTSGSFTWTTGELPQIGLGDVTFGGRLKLGGPNGFELLGVDTNGIPDSNPQSVASITLAGLTNLFQLSTQRPFEVRISGALGSSEFVFFGLGDAKFRFDGVAPEPEFSVASLGFRAGSQLALLQQQNLPFRITAGSIAFVNPNLPLNQLFAPQNLRFTFSGAIDISLAPPDANSSDVPRLFGALDNVQVSLPNGFSGPPQFSVNTFTLLIENLTIGDMAGLSGGLTVGNLNNPSELFFAGTAGGSFNGVSIKAIVAIRLDGLIGACLSVNAGPAGIPLDGGTLGGILLTGAEGGVSLLNQFADPCDFTSYLGLGSDGTPGASVAPAVAAVPATAIRSKSVAEPILTGPQVSHLQVASWHELQRFQLLHEQSRALRAAGVTSIDAAGTPNNPRRIKAAGADVPCPTGDCPPATLNLLCQRHPSVAESPSSGNYNRKYAESVIFKFTSLERKNVDDILASANINLNGTASTVAGNFANAMRGFVNDLIPRPPSGMPAAQRQEINNFIDTSLDGMRGAVAAAVQAGLEGAAGQGRTPLEALYETAYAGVKCVDVTLQLKGTFSYAPVSIALSAEGGAVASTTGSAGILGSVNLFGLPVGTGEFFYSLTDTNGSLNPSLCGGAHVALGPLEFGQLGLAVGCDDCITGELNALAQFVNGLTGQVLSDASPIIYTFIEGAVGARIGNIRSRPLPAYFGAPGSGALLTQQEQVAVLTSLLNLPRVVDFLNANPNAITQFSRNAIRSLSEQVILLSLNIYNALNPRLQFCGEVEPKIFGFSLTGGNTLVAARAYADKTNLRGDLTFSPSYVFGNLPFYLFSGGLVNNVVPALDEATMGMSLGLPTLDADSMRVLVTNPVQYATAQVNHLLDSSTVTFGYELSPFGFKLADGEGRIALPTLASHPDNPGRRSARPQDYNASGQFVAPSFPDRAAILKAALDSNVLAQATWAGKGTDLSRLFPAGSQAAQAVVSRELVRDYFPYGGFLGAAKVQLPKPITDAPPLGDLARLFAPPTNILEQFNIAQTIFNDYVLGSREVGSLMTYVPFPKPPPVFWNIPQSPQGLIDSIGQISVDSLVAQGLGLYPAEQLFMSGAVNAQFLGLPIGQGQLVADPALGLFRLSAGVPTDSWVRKFFDAQMTFEIKRADYIAQSTAPSGAGTNVALLPETRLQAAFDQLIAAAQPGSTTQQKQQAVNNAVARITDTLPKVSLDLALNNFGIPRELTNILAASASARFVAYSPRFEPGFIGTGPVADARRNGGVAFKGRFNFASFVEIDNAELGVALRGTALPALTGVFDVPTLGVPGLALRNAHFEFNSEPAIGGAYIAARGGVDPLSFVNPLNSQPLLTVRNLTNAPALITASFDLRRAASGPPLPGFAISPSRIDIPMLGPGLTLRMHGNTTNDPFAFSSTGPWAAQVSASGSISVRDPLNPANIIATIGSAGSQFSASISGTGMQLDLLAINLPTNITIVAFPGTASQQIFTLGSGGVDNRLRISRDGTFILEGGIGGNLPLNGVGFSSINAGASFRLSNSGLTVTVNANINGGPLNNLTNVNFAGISGQFSATRNGVFLSGVATLSPMQFGVFLVSGAGGGNITAVLTNTGFTIGTGARLRLVAVGYPTNDLFTLNTFSILANGDFNVSATSGALNIPGYFTTTNGSFALIRSNSVVSLDIFSPTLRLFPQKPYQTAIAAPFSHVFMDGTGRFYADTGDRAINLPAGFVARGRLEVGFEPDPNEPELGVATGQIRLGTVNYGSSSNLFLRVTNTGAAPLVAALSSSSPLFTATPANVTLDPGQVQPVSIRFTPTNSGAANGTLSLFHNAGSPVSISLTATGRAVPILRLSSPSLNFGDVKVNRSGALAMRVDNFGITNLLITNNVVGGPFSVTPRTVLIAPGSNAILNVTFSASAVANFNNTLQITSNDPDGTRNVPLAGTAFIIRWIDQRDGVERFTSIAVNGGQRAIAVGEPNTVLFTDNGGHSWNTPDTKLTSRFSGAAMAADGITGWIVGGQNVQRTDDGGRTWTRLVDLDILRSSHVWTCVAEVAGTGRVVVGGSVNGVVTNEIFGNTIVSPASGGMVAVQRSSSGGSFVTNVLGSQLIGTRYVSALASANVSGQFVILAGLGGSAANLFRSSNGGTNWAEVTIFGTNAGSHRVTGLAMNSSGVALLTTDSGEIYRSSNSGSTWTRVHLAGAKLSAIVIDGVNARAVGAKGIVLQSSNSGSSWTLDTTVDTAANLYAVSARANNTWFAGDSGEIQCRPNTPPTGPVLVFQPGALDYGFVPFQDSAALPVTLLNRGISNLTVTNIVLQGFASQFVVAGLPVTIPPEGTHQVNVFFNPSSATTINTTALVRSSDPDGAFVAPVRGQSSVRGWVLKSPLPTSETVVDVHLVSSTIGYAATASGVYKTTNGGVTWRALSVPGAASIRTLHFVDADVGYIGGGRFATTIGTTTIQGTSFIMRTTNGGTNWTTVSSSSSRTPVVNLSMVNDTTGFAVTPRKSSSPTADGVFMRTTNGTAWTTATVPIAPFNGLALEAIGSTEVVASSGSVLYRSADAGSSWAPVLTNSATINDVHFSLSLFGRVVGANGTMRRTTSGGDTPAEWTTVSSFTSSDLNRVHFVSTENTGWVTPADSAAQAAIYRSDDSGATWREELAESPYRGPDSLIPTVVFSRAGTNAVALGTGGSVRRHEAFTNEFIGIAIAAPSIVFTNSVTDFAQTNTLLVRNLGDAPLVISDLLLDGISRTNEGFRIINSVPITLPVNGSVTLSVVAQSGVAGTNNVTLSIISDGALQSLPVELRAAAAPRPDVVTFRTDPPGMPLRIDGVQVFSPASFTLGEVNGPSQWILGSQHAVEAFVTNVVSGQVFAFAGWQPAGDRSFNYGATNGSETFTARFVPAADLGASGVVAGAAVVEGEGPLVAAAAGTTPSVPRGPFLRLTGGSISNSLFGAFQVTGSLLLSADVIEATLANRAMRFPQSTAQPALFEMSAGSWRFMLSTNILQLSASTPSVNILSNSITRPAQITLNLNLTNTHFASTFTLPDGAVIARDLLEVGPSSASLAFSNFFSLSVTGQVRALRQPNADDWAFRQNLNIQFRDGPFTNTFVLPASLVRLTVPGTSSEFFEARGVNNGVFELRRNSSGVFSLFVSNLAIDLLNQPIGTFSGLASAAGSLSLTAAPPAQPFEIGPFRWHAAEASTFVWNVRNGDLRFTIGGGTLKDNGSGSVPGWPSGGMAFPSVSFDSRGDFDQTITLPSFSFNGITLGQAEDNDDKYIRFRRSNGVLSVKLRDRQEFFGSSMSIGFDVNTAGQASGFFSGRCAIDFGPGLGEVNFGRVDLSYDSSPSDPGFQFNGRMKVAGNDFRLKFGSAGAQACHLICGDNGCSTTVCLSAGPGTGTFSVDPLPAQVAPRKDLTLAFGWTVPDPGTWHDLKFIQLRIRDEKNVVFWVGFNEADRTLSIYNKATRKFGPPLTMGTRKKAATPWVVLDLSNATVVTSPTSPTVTINLPLTFKASANHKTYVVEVAATGKNGEEDAFKPAGTITVAPQPR